MTQEKSESEEGKKLYAEFQIKQEEIEAGNKLIAEYLGYKYFEKGVLIDGSDCGGIYDEIDVYSKTPILVNDYGDGEKYFADLPNPDYKNKDNPRWSPDIEKLGWNNLNDYIYNLEYHSSWDWILPVVEEIEKGNYGVKMCRKVVEIYVDDTKELILKVKKASRKESLWYAVVDFIKYKNKEINT